MLPDGFAHGFIAGRLRAWPMFPLFNARHASYNGGMGSGSHRYAFVIHGMDDARTVLTAASDFGRSVALWSAPGAAAYMSAPVFREIIDAVGAEFPDIDVIGVLDCGQDAGYALAALRHGVRFARVELPSVTRDKVTDIARQVGATIVNVRPPALDLVDCADPVAACRDWLSAAADGSASPCHAESTLAVEPWKDLDTPEIEK